MTIVEVIDAHDGFRMLTDRIQTTSMTKLLIVVSIVAFFMSAVLDNLTTTIIMVTLLKKLLSKKEDRWIFGSVIVVAANAGGAWTPIGDVTTTMLWIGGYIESFPIMQHLFVPSLVTLIVCLGMTSFFFKGKTRKNVEVQKTPYPPHTRKMTFVCFSVLMMVPLLKGLLGLPPFINVFIGLGIVWVLSDLLHKEDPKREKYKACQALARVDFQSVIFFLGILLAVAALQSAGLLQMIADKMAEAFPYPALVAYKLGVVSSLLDNVPLVAAVMGMYDLAIYPTNDSFWELVAFCAGTGGSITLIGSAAGVALMGLEKVRFGWYLKKMTPIALVSYTAGYLTYLLFQWL
jgi:Na+/H+ antiporter NhaD/arsenite permease-like protein